MELQLSNPLIVARNGDMVLLAAGDVATNKNTSAQLYDPDDGYGPVTPLQVIWKFIYGFEDVIPPEPWIEPPP